MKKVLVDRINYL